jgi:hypothetical protein
LGNGTGIFPVFGKAEEVFSKGWKKSFQWLESADESGTVKVA